MNILLTMTGSWGTGSGTVVEALTAEFHKHGHRTCILYPETSGVHAFENRPAGDSRHEVWEFPLRDNGVELYTFPLMISDPNPRNFDGAWTYAALTDAQFDLFFRSFRSRLREAVAAFEPDVIECQHIWSMPYACAREQLPFYAMAHHSDQMAFREDARMRPLATEAAQKAECLFALTPGNRTEVIELYGVPEDNVRVMGNGYDDAVFRPRQVDRAALMHEYGLDIPPEAPLVTFAGKLSKTKGVDIILEANGILRRQWKAGQDASTSARHRWPEPPHFILFGTGNLEKTLNAAKADAYCREGVHLLGHRSYEEVSRFHSVAHHSIMPSRTEGFGLAALEAMGCGLPMIVTDIEGPTSYSVGEIVPPEDAEALAKAIVTMLRRSPDDHEALRKRALAAARGYSWETIAEARLEIFEAGRRRSVPLASSQ